MKKKYQEGFINDVSEDKLVGVLKAMQNSSVYLTKPAFRGSSPRWTDNYVSFIDYHLNYLKLHPSLDPEQYISNLRLKLRKNSS